MLGRRFGFVRLVLLSAVALGTPPALAHDLPLNTVSNAFVKIEPQALHVVIRVPLDLLRAVQFPIQGGRYNLPAAGPAIETALNALASDLAVWEDGVRLKPARARGRLTPNADRSFEDYGRAVAHVAQPPAPDTEIGVELGYLDAHLTYPIRSPTSVFTIQTAIAGDLQEHAKLTIRYLPLDGGSRAFLITSRTGRVALNPPWYQAAGGFVALGIAHILSGADHLLFLLCLIIPLRRLRGLVPVISAFTVGHSVTLIGSAYSLAPARAWFLPFVEAAIAASIVYMALENIVGANLRRRWLVSGLFGLVHGFGFSYALKQDLQFAGSHLLVSLLAFNVGIEIGQLVVLAVALAALFALLRGVLAGRMGVILLSAFVAHTGWHWMLERGAALGQAEWPRLDAVAIVALARWVAIVLLTWGAVTILRKRLRRSSSEPVTSAAVPKSRH